MKKVWNVWMLAAGVCVWTACVPAVSFAAEAALSSEHLPAPAGVEGSWSDFASRDGREIAFGDALAAITDKASRDLLGRPVDRDAMRRRIRELAWKVLWRIEGDGPRPAARALQEVIFQNEGLVPDGDFSARAEAETAVLSSVLENKRGVCLSLSLIYLAVADESGLPLYGVSAPGHFFVRYSQGHQRLNIETLDNGGTSRSDGFYRRKFFVRKGESFYLDSLTPRQSLAVYLSQLAAIYTRAGKAEQALELLTVAQKASPDDAEIRTNLGVALWIAGRTDEAVAAWQTAIILDPYDDLAHYQLAAAYADREDWLPAVYHYDESLRLGHACDTQLLRRLEPHRPDALYAHPPREKKSASAEGEKSS